MQARHTPVTPQTPFFSTNLACWSDSSPGQMHTRASVKKGVELLSWGRVGPSGSSSLWSCSLHLRPCHLIPSLAELSKFKLVSARLVNWISSARVFASMEMHDWKWEGLLPFNTMEPLDQLSGLRCQAVPLGFCMHLSPCNPKAQTTQVETKLYTEEGKAPATARSWAITMLLQPWLLLLVAAVLPGHSNSPVLR